MSNQLTAGVGLVVALEGAVDVFVFGPILNIFSVRDIFELGFPFAVLIIISVLSWIFVLFPASREKYYFLTWRFLRSAKNKEVNEAIVLASYLIAALTSTILLVFAIIVALVRKAH